jgi:hypothetical protein
VKSKKLLLFVTFLIIHLCLTSGLESEASEPEPAKHRVMDPDPPNIKHALLTDYNFKELENPCIVIRVSHISSVPLQFAT